MHPPLTSWTSYLIRRLAGLNRTDRPWCRVYEQNNDLTRAADSFKREDVLTMDNASETSHSSPETAYQSQTRRTSRPDRPCDTCRKRKSRCVKEPGQQKCVLCTFHHRDCTYVDEPQRRKRRRVETGAEVDAATDKEERYVMLRRTKHDTLASNS